MALINALERLGCWISFLISGLPRKGSSTRWINSRSSRGGKRNTLEGCLRQIYTPGIDNDVKLVSERRFNRPKVIQLICTLDFGEV